MRATGIEMQPIGIVSTARTRAEDDFWGGVEPRSVLVDELDPSALEGLEQSSSPGAKCGSRSGRGS